MRRGRVGSLSCQKRAFRLNARYRSPEQVAERLDSMIERIREIHKPDMHGENASDVLLVSN